MNMAKVMPLVTGLSGFDALGNKIKLKPGVPRWMEYDEAIKAEKVGDVQLLVGLDTGSVKEPQKTTRRKKGYKRTDMVAESPTDDDASDE